jgi:hypothetical protein
LLNQTIREKVLGFLEVLTVLSTAKAQVLNWAVEKNQLSKVLSPQALNCNSPKYIYIRDKINQKHPIESTKTTHDLLFAFWTFSGDPTHCACVAPPQIKAMLLFSRPPKAPSTWSMG